MTCNANTGIGLNFCGVMTSANSMAQYPGETSSSYGVEIATAAAAYRNNGVQHTYASTSGGVGDVIGFACDFTGGTITIYKNNSGIGSFSIAAGTYFAAYGNDGQVGGAVTANFGTVAFTYTPPATYSQW
jgi:hypothetical protein